MQRLVGSRKVSSDALHLDRTLCGLLTGELQRFSRNMERIAGLSNALAYTTQDDWGYERDLLIQVLSPLGRFCGVTTYNSR